MKNRRRRTAGYMAVLLALLCGMVYCPEPAGAVQAAEQVELPEEPQPEAELPEESDADEPETNGEGGQQEEAPLETMEGNSEAEQDQEQDWDQETVGVSEHTYGGAPETLYPYRSGYYDLLVYDGAKWGRYRIGVQVGARIPGSASYYLYYSMSLIGGEDLGITIAQEDYATMYDNADGYPEEVRQYHLPVRFIHEKTGYHLRRRIPPGAIRLILREWGIIPVILLWIPMDVV